MIEIINFSNVVCPICLSHLTGLRYTCFRLIHIFICPKCDCNITINKNNIGEKKND